MPAARGIAKAHLPHSHPVRFGAMGIDNASQIFGVSNIILLSPSSRLVHIAKVTVAVSLECLLSCGGTAPLPHRRQLRHHVNDIDDTNAVVDSHDMRAVTFAGPEISSVAFHSEEVPIIRVWETLQHLMEGAVPLLESSKLHGICWMSLNARMTLSW
jgi:hypothetical protein